MVILLSVVYITLRSVPEHPPLVFEKVAFNTNSFMSLRKHYNRGNPNFQINFFHAKVL